MRTKLYIAFIPENSLIVYSGIQFKEFMQYLSEPINNIMILTGGDDVLLLNSNFEKGFETIEGRKNLTDLEQADIYALGKFGFIDYAVSDMPQKLTDEQVAELLYLAHMSKPLKNVFYNVLENKFVYLTHDDGFYGRLYCKEINDFMNVLIKKIVKFVSQKLRKEIKNIDEEVKIKLLSILSEGIYFDLDKVIETNRGLKIDIYAVGKVDDIDDLLNRDREYCSCETLKACLFYQEGRWEITLISK